MIASLTVYCQGKTGDCALFASAVSGEWLVHRSKLSRVIHDVAVGLTGIAGVATYQHIMRRSSEHEFKHVRVNRSTVSMDSAYNWVN